MYGNSLLDGVSEAAKARLSPHLRQSALCAGRSVHRSGETPELVYFPTTAVLSCILPTARGIAIEIDMIGKFEGSSLLPALANSPTPVEVVVQIPGTALVVSTSTLRAIAMTDEAFLAHLLKAAATAGARSALKTGCDFKHDTQQRLCCWLLRATDRASQERLMVTQRTLATALGVQRTTVNAAAMVLKRAGVLRYARGGIQIVDHDALVSRSCGCYVSLASSGSNIEVPERQLKAICD